MTIENLNLDTETHAIVQDALNHSGMSLADFIKQACKVYGKTLVGKATQVNDLESISTEELLNNKNYALYQDGLRNWLNELFKHS